MHRSRLHSIMIDCNDLATSTRFWSLALGVDIAPSKGYGDMYAALEPPIPGLSVELQQVPEDKSCKSRVHLDIETDDVEAEVRRLERLGARRQVSISRFWVMEDPSGNEFCVVPVQSECFDRAREWSDQAGQAR